MLQAFFIFSREDIKSHVLKHTGWNKIQSKIHETINITYRILEIYFEKFIMYMLRMFMKNIEYSMNIRITS